MYGLAASKNPVALDNMLSYDCLTSLCNVLEPKEETRNKSLVVNAVDCLWSLARAQNPILTVTCCYTLANIGFTERLLHSLTFVMTLPENETISDADVKFV